MHQHTPRERAALIAAAILSAILAVIGISVLASDARADGALPPPAPAGANCKVITHRGLLDGTENQLAGVTEAGRWGWAEVDADLTADGKVVGIHDATVGRLTGGDLSGYVNEHTMAELNASSVSHPLGLVRLTTSLIGRAARDDVPIMVTINRWDRQTAAERTLILDTLYAAAQAHPRPHLVYFGGYGPEDAMHARHPDAATFHRYENSDVQEDIYADVAADSVDLAALPTGYFQGEVVQAVRDAGASRVATRQLFAARDARAAQAAGISTIQGNDARQIATAWCLP